MVMVGLRRGMDDNMNLLNFGGRIKGGSITSDIKTWVVFGCACAAM